MTITPLPSSISCRNRSSIDMSEILRSFTRICIAQKAELMSNIKKYTQPPVLSISSSISSIGYDFGIPSLFSCLRSMHNLDFPSPFLLTIVTGAANGEVDFEIRPASSSLLVYLFIMLSKWNPISSLQLSSVPATPVTLPTILEATPQFSATLRQQL